MYKTFTSFIAFTLFSLMSFSQGLPPGWQYTVTPVTHIISVPLSCDPDINGYDLQYGDYIGVFYLNNQGILSCGGAVEWWGDQNVGLIAFGDDTWSPVKDGFSANELINWKVYSWRVNKEYPATVTYNTNLPNSNGLFVSNGLSGLASLDANGLFVWATASPDTACVGMPVSLNAEPSGSSGYSFSWVSVPPGFNSTLPNPVVYPNIGTKYVVTVTAESDLVRDTVIPVINPGPMGSVGSNAIICQDSYYQANAYATNYSSLLWQSSGDGIFDDPYILNPKYYPGPTDIGSGTVTLSLAVYPIEPCSGIVNPWLVLTIQKLPEVDAGEDQNVCQNSVIQLAGSISNASSVLWVTSGDGSFTNPQISNPQYFPGPGDISNGSVQLQLIAYAVVPCSISDMDELIVTFSSEALANSGDDLVSCVGSEVEVNGFASSYESILWSTSGDGNFTNPAALSTLYIPGLNDLLVGTAYLKLTAFSLAPCTGQAVDSLLLTIQQAPSVEAGAEVTIPPGSPVSVSGECENCSSWLWSTAGDGTFENPSQLVTQYYHGSGDRNEGGVWLYLAGQPVWPCVVESMDSLYVTIDTTVNITDYFDEKIRIFPNPASTEVNFYFPHSSETYVVKIIGMDGVLQHELLVTSDEKVKNIDICFLAKGVYCFEIYLRNINIWSQKIVLIK